jgi:hypothetical protein
MRFEWDEEKNLRNIAKHRISFQTAKLVFDDPSVVIQEDRVVDGEERWKALDSWWSGCRIGSPHPFRGTGKKRDPRYLSPKGGAGRKTSV